MSELETLWLVTMVSPSPGVVKTPEPIAVRAQICGVQKGALIFRGSNNLSILIIIAAGQWLMVEKEQTE